jgi:RNA polymerase sigma-70 factor (ECF subfamily)
MAGDALTLAEQFEELRPHLRAVAYGTLGTLAEADDVVQEAWLRLQQTDTSEIRDLRAFLTTVVGRLALDALGSARRQREKYVGPWLPEPLVDDDPADRVTLDESVTMALMVVLETLSPAERTAFVLHDVFGMSFADVAGVVGRSPAAVRQLGARARKHVDEGRPRFSPSREEHERIVGAFVAALGDGDVDQMLRLLDPDVVFVSDGGGITSAALHPLRGAERVVRMLLGMRRSRRNRDMRGRAAIVNGRLGLVTDIPAGGDLTVISFTIDGGLIVAIDSIRNPEKLTHVEGP